MESIFFRILIICTTQAQNNIMSTKVCCIFNLAPHYRQPIYQAMDRDLGCDFYFGDKVDTPIKIMDVESLKGYKKTVRNIRILNTGWIWQSSVIKLVFKPYKHYILTGDPYIVTSHLIAIFSRLLNKRVYVWAHGMKGNSRTKKRFLQLLFFRLSHKVLLYGEYSMANMLKEGFKKNKLIPIYNSLDYDQQLEFRKKLRSTDIYQVQFKNNDPVLIYIGRLQKSKRLDLLIEAISELKQMGKPCNLVIIGKDVEGTKLEDLVVNSGLEDRVWFYGPCYDESEISKLIYDADLCVSPGPIGLTALHSLTYGTPIITNDNFSKQMPEFEVIQAGITGEFFKEGDLSDLVVKIKKWIDLSHEKRNEVRDIAYSMIDNKYNPHYQIDVLKKLLTE